MTARHTGLTNQQGFTIFETACALIVMTVVGLAAAGGFVYAIRYNAGAADRAGAVSIAQTAMEKFRAIPFSDASLTAGTTSAVVTDSVGRTYSVSTTVSDKIVVSGKVTLKSITILVAPVNSSGTIATNAYDYFGSVKLYTERCNPAIGINIH